MSTALASNCRDDRLCFVLRPFPPLGWSPGPAALAAKPTDRWKSGGADFDGAAVEVVVAVAVGPLHLARGAEEWRWWWGADFLQNPFRVGMLLVLLSLHLPALLAFNVSEHVERSACWVPGVPRVSAVGDVTYHVTSSWLCRRGWASASELASKEALFLHEARTGRGILWRAWRLDSPPSETTAASLWSKPDALPSAVWSPPWLFSARHLALSLFPPVAEASARALVVHGDLFHLTQAF